VVNRGTCITDGSGNYGNNQACIFRATVPLTLSTHSFVTETGYDTLIIDGHTVSSQAKSGGVSSPAKSGGGSNPALSSAAAYAENLATDSCDNPTATNVSPLEMAFAGLALVGVVILAHVQIHVMSCVKRASTRRILEHGQQSSIEFLPRDEEDRQPTCLPDCCFLFTTPVPGAAVVAAHVVKDASNVAEACTSEQVLQEDAPLQEVESAPPVLPWSSSCEVDATADAAHNNTDTEMDATKQQTLVEPEGDTVSREAVLDTFPETFYAAHHFM
jgi:hypothetical protein